jgi:F0F1-type ATP synthase membrane subunit b/b'
MSTETLLEAQTLALLRRLGHEQEARTRRADEDAAEQARDIVRRARSEARARVSQAVTDTRREIDLAIARRKAAIETRERRARQTTLRRLLDDAWQRLPSALEQRWDDARARAAWCRSACDQAARSLLGTANLVVEIDARWCDELRPVVAGSLGTATGSAPQVVALTGLGPGLRIRAGRACVDATVTGLVAARERIAAELLAVVDQHLAPCAEVAS